MPKLIITRGLPGSGKTTWAKDWLYGGGGRVRVNRDDLRMMLFGLQGVLSREQENLITEIRDGQIKAALAAGHDVVADDTNLVLKYANQLAKLAYEAGAEFEVKSFLDVPVETCIAQDAFRDGLSQVGERVIRMLHGRFFPMIHGQTVQYELAARGTLMDLDRVYVADTSKPEAIICDLDGTLANLNGRDPYDESRVSEDLLNEAVWEILCGWMDQEGVETDRVILFTSGRSDACREDTESWLASVPHFTISGDCTYHRLFMRRAGDQRQDAVIKLEIFDTEIRDNYNVRYVLDDRQQVVDMWRSLGLTCLQVAPGDF